MMTNPHPYALLIRSATTTEPPADTVRLKVVVPGTQFDAPDTTVTCPIGHPPAGVAGRLHPAEVDAMFPCVAVADPAAFIVKRYIHAWELVRVVPASVIAALDATLLYATPAIA